MFSEDEKYSLNRQAVDAMLIGQDAILGNVAAVDRIMADTVGVADHHRLAIEPCLPSVQGLVTVESKADDKHREVAEASIAAKSQREAVWVVEAVEIRRADGDGSVARVPGSWAPGGEGLEAMVGE